MKILFPISPIGLGHATRSVAIGIKLRELGYDITFASSAKVCRFLNSYDFPCMVVHDKVPYFDISKNGVLRNTLLWMIRYIRFYKRMKKVARRIIPDFDFIISDEEFAFGNEALELGKPLIFISDLYTTNFARNFVARIIEERTNRWFSEFFKRPQLVIALEDYFPDYPNIKKIWPIVRETRRGREEIRSSLGKFDKLITVVAGGGDAGNFIYHYALRALENLDLKNSLVIIVSHEKFCDGGRVRKKCFHFYRNLHELIYASDLVITTAGKTTIDECLVYGTPFIAIPIKNHYEQERNAARFGFSYGDIFRLEKLISEKINTKRSVGIRNKLNEAVNEVKKMIDNYS